jgi:hypothetical protein
VLAIRQALHDLRAYWNAALLGLAAAMFLALGAPTKAALAGAAFALLGAALTRAIDLATEHRAQAARAGADRRRDLDETRRLLLAALEAGPVVHSEPMLVATLVNALAYHGLAADPVTANRHIHNLGQAESRRWVQDQIEQITTQLGS